MLSALAFAYDAANEAVHYGGSAEIDPMRPAIVRVPHAGVGWFLHTAPTEVAVEDDEYLRLALGLYREGLNAGSPFYCFLAFWNVLDPAFSGDEKQRNKFLREQVEPRRATWAEGRSLSGDPIEYLEQSGRHAIAHVLRKDPSMTSIDPDQPSDRIRLTQDATQLRSIVRLASETRWASPVHLTERA